MGSRLIPMKPDRRSWVLLGFGLSSVLVAIDLAIGGQAIMISLLVAGPLLVAVRAGPRPTALVGAYAAAVSLPLGIPDDMFGSVEHLVLVLGVVVGGTLAVWIALLRERAEREQARAAFLAEAGARLDQSLDYQTAVETLSKIAVPWLADWCSVYTVGGNGDIRLLAIAHQDPVKQKFAWELERRYPLDPDMSSGVPNVIRTGTVELVEEIEESAIDDNAYDAEHARLMRAMGLRSAIVVPLMARGRTLGALAVAMAESGRRLKAEDLRLAESFAERGALSIDNARLYTQVSETEAGLRESAEEVSAILKGVASGITVQDPSGKLVFANETAVRMLGASSVEALLETPTEQILERYEICDEDRKLLPNHELPGRLALEGQKPSDRVLRFKEKATGEERWSVVKATPILDERGNVSLVVNIFDDISEQKRDELGERLLSESSRLLSASLEYETTLDNIAHLAVPGFADWCTVDLVDERGAIKQVALAHADPSKIEFAEQMRENYPADPDSARGVPNVVRTGEPELYPEVSEELLAEAAQDEKHAGVMRAMGFRSAIVAPMVVAGKTIGALTFVTAESGRRFDERDLELATELGHRAATAVENARLYAERSHIARTLQRSLLPPVLPDIPGVEVAARFRPAGEGYEVGGDFYDVFNTGASWAFVIGDVCGKGPEAASLTGLARHTLRAAAMQERDPSRILAILSEAIMREHPDSQFCTAAYGRLESTALGVRLTLASGGHPLPLLLTSDGQVEQIGVSGAALGLFPDAELVDQSLNLEPGAAVVLYTDGVIEAGSPRGAFGIEGLSSVLASCLGLSANEIAERVDTAALGLSEQPPDDVAVLVLRIKQ
jgi:PAS domain S-box-containing protein